MILVLYETDRICTQKINLVIFCQTDQVMMGNYCFRWVPNHRSFDIQ